MLLPWHLTDFLADGIGVAVPGDTIEIQGRPSASTDPWLELVGVYSGLVDAVAEHGDVAVLAGDCLSAVAVLAGMQRKGLDPAVVWFDAHGDFHTEETTISGYRGGLPLAKVVGLGDPTFTRALGMSPIAQDRAVLVDARDLDPPEVTALAASDVRHVAVEDLAPDVLPDGPLLLHVDLDVLDPENLRGLRFPARGGPTLDAVATGVRTVATSGRVSGLSVAATWRPDGIDPSQADEALSTLLAAAGR